MGVRDTYRSNAMTSTATGARGGPAGDRTTSIPTPSRPPELPITDRADEIVAAIRDHQVVVVAGETGSGKSTQLPKLCLEAGRGTNGLIGHTQPRRIAARAVAERVAEELNSRVGDLVGYAVRFTDTVSKRSVIKVMTDGILLNELQRDRQLRAYDTIIIDEAHERGLNIDFVLGYLAQLLPTRPDLKLIITSATIDTERFAAHFATDGVPAPIIEVSGRTYPVDVRYRPLEHADRDGNVAELDLVDGIVEAVEELVDQGPGDILVFASGERDIRDAADALGKAKLKGTEILPLYARLSAAEQHRVFSGHKGRRIVIATNIAETSLTVPGIRYVVDPGLARMSRYSRKTKVQRLPIEKISQASANQRSGRCGRLGPGVAIRLYAEEDFEARPAFTEPEILRTNLASVILRMTAIGLGDVDAFPFLEAPDRRQVADGVALLEELGAIVPDASAPGGRALTEVGTRLARLPVDPRLARMVLAAEEEGCVHEVMVIASGLSIQDPRERPQDKAHTAEQYHARFVEPGSDFLTLLNLWDHLRDQQHQLSGNQFRKRCRQEFLHWLRVREWQDVYSQLRRIVKDLGIAISKDPDNHDGIHRSMLAGLLSNVGVRDGDSREYLGTRSTRFVLGRRSALADHPPGWVVAAELVETNRLWASMASAIRPRWIEELAGDLVTRSHSDPEWSRNRAAATTLEKVVFRGLPIVQGRRINLGRINRAQARAMFIEHALVNGDWDHSHRFLAANADTVARVRELEARLRRPGLLAPEDVLADHYDAHVGADVVNGASFDKWWRGVSRDRPHLLDVTVDQLLAGGHDSLADLTHYPDTWTVGGNDLSLDYAYDPEDPQADGVTVDIPLEMLPRIQPGHFDWQVPGFRHELIVALIRALPKSLRRALVPAPDTATRALQHIGPDDGPLLPALARELTRLSGVTITPQDWAGARLPPHLRMRYRIVGDKGPLASGTDLSALKEGVATHLRSAVRKAAPFPEQRGLTDWTFGDLPRVVSNRAGDVEVHAYPTLVDEGTTAGVRSVTTEAEQARAMAAGTRRLLRLALPTMVRVVAGQLDQQQKLQLTMAPHPDVPAVIEDCLDCVIDAIVEDAGGPAWTAADFAELRRDVRERAPRLVVVTARATAHIVQRAGSVRERLRQPLPPSFDDAKRDVAQQLGRMVYPGFVARTGGSRLPHLPRYLQGMVVRLETMGRNPDRDREGMALVRDLEEELRLLIDTRGPSLDPVATQSVRWQLEELRISLFAQQVGTAERISEARVRQRLLDLRTGRA